MGKPYITKLANQFHFGNIVVLDDPMITLDNNFKSPLEDQVQGMQFYDTLSTKFGVGLLETGISSEFVVGFWRSQGWLHSMNRTIVRSHSLTKLCFGISTLSRKITASLSFWHADVCFVIPRQRSLLSLAESKVFPD
ncbi:hypothetical protein Tco_1564453 [Tanacetum coccineum]